jgi:hypothetical protein
MDTPDVLSESTKLGIIDRREGSREVLRMIKEKALKNFLSLP